ncbi:MAG TPA: xylanase, partial [bacterium]|nr:xylanase [bacterium]HPR89068.1 xylanase [bacterium]
MKHTLLYTGITIALIWSAAGCSKESATSPEELPAGAAAIHLDQSSQLIRGFGGVNMPGWIPDLTPDQILTAFGTGEGQIGLSILRIRVPHDPSAFALEVPAARLAHTLGAILIASPWTPPAWMKTNRNIVGGSLSDTSYASYAAHLQAFAGYMAANGAPLYAVSVQNEPDVTVSYESCDWTAAQLVRFLRQNVAAIGTRIIVPESYNFNPATADAILNDGTAAAAVDIIGGHIYGGGVRSYPLAASKGKELWMTEHLETDTDWIGALFTATEIHDCMKAGMNAYIWWYIRRFYGPIDDDGRVTKRGWVMAQYARFV